MDRRTEREGRRGKDESRISAVKWERATPQRMLFGSGVNFARGFSEGEEQEGARERGRGGEV